MSSNNNRRVDGQNAMKAAGQDGNGDAFSLISDEKLIALYANLLKCRMVGQGLAALPDHRLVNGNSSWRGHEAGAVGVAIDLTSDDTICSPDHGVVAGFQKDSSIEAMLLLSGTHGGCNGFGGGSRPVARSRGNGIAPGTEARTHNTQAALGAALASKTRKNGGIAVVFGGADAPALWNEALQIASQHTLPMIFVNREVGRPKQARPSQDAGSKQARSKRGRSKEPGDRDIPRFPDIAVDRDDVVAVYRVANEAISRARLGRGPTLIECRPFHVQGKANGIGTSNGNGTHMRDPIANMENYLRGKGLFQAGLKSEILGSFAKQLESTLSRFRHD